MDNPLIEQLATQFGPIFDAMSDGLWICDATPRLLWINRACEDLNDIRREDVCGQLVQDLLTNRNFDQDVTSMVIRRKQPVAINQKVRSGRTLLVSGVPVFNDDGDVIYIVGNERDVTELNMLRGELDKTQQLTRKMHSELQGLKLRDRMSGDIVCESEAMERVLDTALRVADFDSTVLLSGPSGSGKTMIARMIHDSSSRKEGPFLSLNCGAIPQSLIEAELFGYTEGAFTGALRGGKPGLLQAADRGTLFLDEIDAFPLEAQVKLLTFLDTQGFMRVGGIKIEQVDVRLITATNKNLSLLASNGEFREDLWFRLNVVPLKLPPLSERREDIPPLVSRILEGLNKRYGTEREISRDALDLLCRCELSGNVRELQNILERSLVLCQGPTILPSDLPKRVHSSISANLPDLGEGNMKQAVQKVEREFLERACNRHHRQVDIAKALDVSQATVARMLKKHDLKSHP